MSDSPKNSKGCPDSTDLTNESSEHVPVSTDVVEQDSSLASSDDENKASKSEVAESSATPVNLQSCILKNLDKNEKLLEPDALCETHKNISSNVSPIIKEAAKNLDPDESKTLPPNNLRLDFSEKDLKGAEGSAFHDAASTSDDPFKSTFSEIMIEEFKADIKSECENIDSEIRESAEFKYLNVAEGFEEKDYKGKDFPQPILNPTLESYKNFVRAKAFLQLKYRSLLTLNLAKNVQEFFSNFNARVSNSVPSKDIETGECQNCPTLQTRVCEYWIIVDFLSRHTLSLLSLFKSADEDSETQLLNYLCVLAKIYAFLSFRIVFMQHPVQRKTMAEKDYHSLCFLSSNLSYHIPRLQDFIKNYLSYSNQ